MPYCVGGYKHHACKGKRWIVRKYFTTFNGDNWRFHCITKDKSGNKKPLYFKRASDTKIRRHVKIKSEDNLFDPKYKEYFIGREAESKRRKVISSYSNTAGLRIIQPYLMPERCAGKPVCTVPRRLPGSNLRWLLYKK